MSWSEATGLHDPLCPSETVPVIPITKIWPNGRGLQECNCQSPVLRAGCISGWHDWAQTHLRRATAGPGKDSKRKPARLSCSREPMDWAPPWPRIGPLGLERVMGEAERNTMYGDGGSWSVSPNRPPKAAVRPRSVIPMCLPVQTYLDTYLSPSTMEGSKQPISGSPTRIILIMLRDPCRFRVHSYTSWSWHMLRLSIQAWEMRGRAPASVRLLARGGIKLHYWIMDLRFARSSG